MLTGAEFFGGWFGGLCGLLASHPLDTLKVRRQAMQMSLSHIFLSTLKEEGVRGFYKGMGFPFFTAGLYTSLFFGIYSNTLRNLQLSKGSEENRFCLEPGERYRGWHVDVLIAGGVGGFASCLFGCPIELVKTILQMQRGTQSSQCNGMWGCGKEIYLTGGLRMFYRGFLPMLWRDVPSFGLYMLAYEHIVGLLHGPLNGAEDLTSGVKIISGGLAGMASWIPAIPFDVVKSRIQSDSFKRPVYKGMIDCIIKSYKADGIGVFQRGIWLSLFRTFPKNAATFYGFEFLLKSMG